MEMILHEDVTIQDDMIRPQSVIQQLKKHVFITIILEYCPPFVTPAGHLTPFVTVTPFVTSERV
jgi:hypothetical protein